jgi:hypothetical protein
LDDTTDRADGRRRRMEDFIAKEKRKDEGKTGS